MIQQFHFWMCIWRTWKYLIQKVKHLHGHCSIIYKSQDIKTTLAFIDTQVEKEYVEYVYVCVCVCVFSVTKSCLTLCNPMDCSLQGSSVHGIILQEY